MEKTGKMQMERTNNGNKGTEIPREDLLRMALSALLELTPKERAEILLPMLQNKEQIPA